MAVMNFGGMDESVVTREEFPLSKAREVLKSEVIAVIGYGVLGPAQALNLRDNGFSLIIGQRRGTASWAKAISDGWIPEKTLFEIDEACRRASIVCNMLSDAGQIELWPRMREHLTAGKALSFAHGFGIAFQKKT